MSKHIIKHEQKTFINLKLASEFIFGTCMFGNCVNVVINEKEYEFYEGEKNYESIKKYIKENLYDDSSFIKTLNLSET